MTACAHHGLYLVHRGRSHSNANIKCNAGCSSIYNYAAARSHITMTTTPLASLVTVILARPVSSHYISPDISYAILYKYFPFD
jgi:hypothetical protein